MSEMKKLLFAAAGAAIDAGQRIMEVYVHPETNWEVERKADNSPLTIADRRAHAAIAAVLEKTPYPVLSEEGAQAPYAERSAWKTLWIVDPLDGTKEFLKRNGEFTVNIALVDSGKPLAGVIYVPASGVLYVGIVGEGAFRLELAGSAAPASWEQIEAEGKRLPFAAHEGYVVVASRSHLSPETEAFVDECRRAHADVELRSAGSSLKICLVAEGNADVYPRLAPTMEWDTAAGHAIAEAAGCKVLNAATGEPLAYNKENLLNPFFVVSRTKNLCP